MARLMDADEEAEDGEQHRGADDESRWAEPADERNCDETGDGGASEVPEIQPTHLGGLDDDEGGQHHPEREEHRGEREGDEDEQADLGDCLGNRADPDVVCPRGNAADGDVGDETDCAGRG